MEENGLFVEIIANNILWVRLEITVHAGFPRFTKSCLITH